MPVPDISTGNKIYFYHSLSWGKKLWADLSTKIRLSNYIKLLPSFDKMYVSLYENVKHFWYKKNMSMQWWKVSILKQNFPYYKTKYLSILKKSRSMVMVLYNFAKVVTTPMNTLNMSHCVNKLRHSLHCVSIKAWWM